MAEARPNLTHFLNFLTFKSSSGSLAANVSFNVYISNIKQAVDIEKSTIYLRHWTIYDRQVTRSYDRNESSFKLGRNRTRELFYK